jgi:4'-phosphopantetheinyl transferase
VKDAVEFDVTWSFAPDHPQLKKQDVHLWLVQLDDPRLDIECCEELLAAGERDRASRFKFKRDRRRYLVAHAALRSILARYLLVSSRDLEFSSGARGKPKLAPLPGTDTLAFNLSHSHEVALVAVSRQGEIGVDVEYVKRDFPFQAVAERFFSPKEIAALTGLPSQLQSVAFFKCWTSKEAFLKAKGTGLFGELDEVNIILTDHEAVRVNGTLTDWALSEITINKNYVAAIVVEAGEHELSCYHWRPAEVGLRPSS